MLDKIGSFIIDIASTDLNSTDKELLAHPLVGGIILFARNYKSRHQLIELCAAIRRVRKSKLLIMVDQEGGRVQRFITDFTRLPAMAKLGDYYNEHRQAACQLTKDVAWLMATELLNAGVDLTLAPVLDLYTDKNKAIGDRAFHTDHRVVIQLATAFIEGMHEAGMASTGKHFPGHGSVTLDSHVSMPVDERSLDEIENSDMIPFAGMIKAGITNIMASHIVYPKVDNLPVGFSKKWLKEILRHQLGFKGIIVSDDLNMEGANISANYTDRVQAARDAGCDFVLLCNNRAGVIKVIDELPYEKHLVDKSKWSSLSGNIKQTNEHFQNKRWQLINKHLQTIGNLNSYERTVGT